MPVDVETLRRGLALTVEHVDLRGLGPKIEGKVRDCYRRDGQRILVATDRISAFDRVLGTLPFKGQVLNQLSAWWFERTKDVAASHLVSTPDPCVTIGLECQPLLVEWVMRAYLTGITSTSVWTHYETGERIFCGHTLPDGLRKNEPLPEPILTPATKAEKGAHDENISRQEILQRGILDEAVFAQAQAIVSGLFARGREIAAARGLILVDTKYELGLAPDGRMLVIDEIHTPDSSRYWIAETYEQRLRAGQEPEGLDKEYVRRWMAEQGYRGEGAPPKIADEVRVEAARRYIDACDRVRGEPFVPDLSPPLERIRKNLGVEA